MKKLSLFALIIVLILTLASCRVYDDTKEIISDVQADETVHDENITETVALTLYFPDHDVLYLYPEIREVEINKGEHLAPVVLEELFKGPLSENLSPSLDGEDLVLSVVVSEGLCTVDFDDDFTLLNTGGTARETFAIGSIVNSLCELDGIEQVKINIGGNTNAEFGGHFSLEAPFSAQKDLIVKQ